MEARDSSDYPDCHVFYSPAGAGEMIWVLRLDYRRHGGESMGE
jgi:hypothetical protein